MMQGRHELSALVIDAARSHSQGIVEELVGVQAVVIATIDGFEVASSLRKNMDVARLAALASSISAIGEVVSSEASLGKPRCITVETDAGFALTHGVARADVSMVINVLCGPDAILAQVKYRAASAAVALEKA